MVYDLLSCMEYIKMVTMAVLARIAREHIAAVNNAIGGHISRGEKR